MENENNSVVTESPKKEQKGLSIAALVLGIISVVLSSDTFLALPCGILAIIFGAKGKKRDAVKLAKAGFILGIIGTALSGWFIFEYLFFGFFWFLFY